MSGWEERIASRNRSIREAGRWRSLRPLDTGRPRTRLSASGREVVSFASNDYLGLSQHPDVVAAAHEALDANGAGAGAARLIVGARPVHDELEAELAEWTGRAAALLFPTGFQANLGVLGALAAAATDCVILSDELNHASIIDGCRQASARVEVYRHNDVDHVTALLDSHHGRPVLVVTDSVFSMDGDAAPLAELAEACDGRDALLVVDEAHAVLRPPAPDGAVIVGTLSKSTGALGGFVAADRATVELCLNTARSFIFTTAGTPADAAAALASVRIQRSAEGERLRARLRDNIEVLAPGHDSPILAIVLGAEDRALAATAQLLEQGLLVPAIRPPTVAPGTCRLRVAISAAHERADLVALRTALDELAPTGSRP